MSYKEFHSLVKNGDLDGVMKMLREQPDVLSSVDDETKATPLHVAVEAGEAQIAQYLIFSKANLEATRTDGCTPMHIAARAGDVTICRMLIIGSASIACVDNAGNTPLHYACLYKHPAVAKLLVLEGGDVSQPNTEGQTPLALVNSDIEDPEATERRPYTFAAIRDADTQRKQLDIEFVREPNSQSDISMRRRAPQRSQSQLSANQRIVGRSISMDTSTPIMLASRRTNSTANIVVPTAMPVELPESSSDATTSESNVKRPRPTSTGTQLPIKASSTSAIIGPSVSLEESLNLEAQGKELQTNKGWSVEDMNFGDSLVPNIVSRKHRIVLNRLAERRITELLGETRILELLQIPGTANKPKFYKRELVFPNQKYKGVFGVPLSLCLKQTLAFYKWDDTTILKLPFIVQQCLEYLNAEGLQQDGLFRKPGNSRRMSDLQNIFDGKPVRRVDMKEFSVHDVAGVLKRYIRELPEPIFTARLQNLFFAALEIKDPRRKLICLQLLILVLPLPNRDLLHALLFFLHKVHLHADIVNGNKMTSKNLAVVFAPNMARNLALLTTDKDKLPPLDLQQEQEGSAQSQRLVEFLIDHCEELFIFQRLKVSELPLSRKSSSFNGSRTRALTDGQTSRLSGLYEKSRSPLSRSVDPEDVQDDEDDLNQEDSDNSDNEAEASAEEPTPETVVDPNESRESRFLRDPRNVFPELMANLETRTETKVRRLSDFVGDSPESPSSFRKHPPSKKSQPNPLFVAGSAPNSPASNSPASSIIETPQPVVASSVSLTDPASPSSVSSTGTSNFSASENGLPSPSLSSSPPLTTMSLPSSPLTSSHAPSNQRKYSQVGRTLSDESAELSFSDEEEGRFDAFAGGIFIGQKLNEEIARQFLTDFKKNHEFVFGDIRKKDAKKLQTQQTAKNRNRSQSSTALLPPDPKVLSILEEIEKLSLDELVERMKDSTKGIEVKDRRKGFKTYKNVFLGKDAVDWLMGNSLDGKQISRRQAIMIGRELLEIGAFVHVTETYGFRDESVFYRFGSKEQIPVTQQDNFKTI